MDFYRVSDDLALVLLDHIALLLVHDGALGLLDHVALLLVHKGALLVFDQLAHTFIHNPALFLLLSGADSLIPCVAFLGTIISEIEGRRQKLPVRPQFCIPPCSLA